MVACQKIWSNSQCADHDTMISQGAVVFSPSHLFRFSCRRSGASGRCAAAGTKQFGTVLRPTPCWLAGWLAGCLAAWLPGWLAGGLAAGCHAIRSWRLVAAASASNHLASTHPPHHMPGLHPFHLHCGISVASFAQQPNNPAARERRQGMMREGEAPDDGCGHRSCRPFVAPLTRMRRAGSADVAGKWLRLQRCTHSKL